MHIILIVSTKQIFDINSTNFVIKMGTCSSTLPWLENDDSTNQTPSYIREKLKDSIAESDVLKPFLDSWSLEELDQMVNRFTPINLKKGKFVFKLAEPSTDLFVVYTGCVQILDKDHRIIQSVSRGGFLGEEDFFRNISYSTFAITNRKCLLYKLSKADYKSLTRDVDFVIKRIPLLTAIPPDQRKSMDPFVTVMRISKQTILYDAANRESPKDFQILLSGTVSAGSKIFGR